MSIEKLLVEAEKSGRLTGLTLWPCAGGWQANVQRKTTEGQEGWTCITAADLVDGLTRALTGAFTSVSPQPTKTFTPPSEDIFG